MCVSSVALRAGALVLLAISLMFTMISNTGCTHRVTTPPLVMGEMDLRYDYDVFYEDINGDGERDLIAAFGRTTSNTNHWVKVWLLQAGHSNNVTELMQASPNVTITQLQKGLGEKQGTPQKFFLKRIIVADLTNDGRGELLVETGDGIYLLRPSLIVAAANDDQVIVLSESEALYQETQFHSTISSVSVRLTKAPHGMWNVVLKFTFAAPDNWTPEIQVEKIILASENFNPFQGYDYLPESSLYREKPVPKRGRLPPKFR